MSALEMPTPIAAWHAIARSRDLQALATLLHDDAVFHSPVVHTPQRGKAVVLRTLAGAMQVLGNASFRYVRQIHGARDSMLEFTATIDGIEVNGIDLIAWDDAGRTTAPAPCPSPPSSTAAAAWCSANSVKPATTS